MNIVNYIINTFNVKNDKVRIFQAMIDKKSVVFLTIPDCFSKVFIVEKGYRISASFNQSVDATHIGEILPSLYIKTLSKILRASLSNTSFPAYNVHTDKIKTLLIKTLFEELFQKYEGVKNNSKFTVGDNCYYLVNSSEVQISKYYKLHDKIDATDLCDIIDNLADNDLLLDLKLEFVSVSFIRIYSLLMLDQQCEKVYNELVDLLDKYNSHPRVGTQFAIFVEWSDVENFIGFTNFDISVDLIKFKSWVINYLKMSTCTRV